MARPVLTPTRKQKAALDFLVENPDAGLALTTQQTISALRAGCKCVPPYRGCVQCIAATLIERMSKKTKPLTVRQADRLCTVINEQVKKAVYSALGEEESL